MAFCGYTSLGDSFLGTINTENVGGTPTDADSAPTFRVYGPAGTIMGNGTGSASFMDSGTITGATNANPIVIACVGHGLSTGTRVTIAGVLGNTAANGNWQVTVIDADHFSIPTAGNGAYTSGGTWHVSGLYKYTVSCTGNNGYEAGETYVVLGTSLIGGQTVNDTDHFTVR